jgi:hypothetical protein
MIHLSTLLLTFRGNSASKDSGKLALSESAKGEHDVRAVYSGADFGKGYA